MKRRDFIAALGGAAAMPLAARAQERIRRIGVLMGYAEEDPEAKLRLAAFVQRLASLGWDQGRNLAMDVRWTAGDVNKATLFAKELVALQPEVIFANTTPVAPRSGVRLKASHWSSLSCRTRLGAVLLRACPNRAAT